MNTDFEEYDPEDLKRRLHFYLGLPLEKDAPAAAHTQDRAPAAVPATPAAAAPVAPGFNPPALPPGSVGSGSVDIKKTVNTIAPLDSSYRAELVSDLGHMRGDTNLDDQRNLYSFMKQKQGLEDLSSEIARLKAAQDAPAPSPDLVIPAIATAQWLSAKPGTSPDMMASYKEMMAPQLRKEAERREMIEKLTALKQKQEQGIANADVAWLKAVIPQVLQGQETQQIKNQYGPPKVSANPQVNNPMEKLWTEFKRVAQPEMDALSAGKQARELLNQGSTTADQMVKRQLIRLAGDQRPSNEDVRAFGGDSRLLERAQQFYDSLFGSGTFTPSNREELNAILNGMERIAQGRFEEKLHGHASAAYQFQPTLRDKSVDEIAAALKSRSMGITPAQPSGKAGAGAKKAADAISGPPIGTVMDYGGKKFKRVRGGQNTKDAWEEVK